MEHGLRHAGSAVLHPYGAEASKILDLLDLNQQAVSVTVEVYAHA